MGNFTTFLYPERNVDLASAVEGLKRLLFDRPDNSVFVVTKPRDGKLPIVEVYTDLHAATKRQRELGMEHTTLVSRIVDDAWATSEEASAGNGRTYDDGVMAGRRALLEHIGWALAEMAGEPHPETTPLGMPDVMMKVRQICKAEREHLGEQIDRLSTAVLKTGYLPEEGEGACDTAIRLLEMLPPGPFAGRVKAAVNAGITAKHERRLPLLAGMAAVMAAEKQRAGGRADSIGTEQPVSDVEAETIARLRECTSEVAQFIERVVPTGAAHDDALRFLDVASMMAVAGVARGGSEVQR